MPTTIPNTIEINHQPYPLIATRRKGTRRFVLRFNAKKQAVTLSLPMRASLRDALKFAHAHTVWLENQIAKTGGIIELRPGMEVSILGEKILLQHEPGRGLATYCAADTKGEITRSSSESIAHLTIHGDIAFFKRRLKDWVTKHLREQIHALAHEKAELLGVKFTRIQIRDANSHWGSCSPTGTLSFSLRLAFADRTHVDYIVCHEVAHLKELNHSSRFWKLVGELCPDYPKHRRWLKTHGHALGRFAL